MEALLEQRKIALWLMHLKRSVPAQNRSKAGDNLLADMLNEHLRPPIKQRDVNELVNVTMWLDAPRRRQVLRALEAVTLKNELVDALSLEGWLQIEDDLKSQLPEALRELRDEQIRGGIMLGELVKTFEGAWRLSYVSPVDREGRAESEVRETLLIFKKAEPAQTEMHCEIISGHTRWFGRAFAHDEHVLIEASEANRTDSVSFIITRPRSTQRTFIGLGLALQRTATHAEDVRPILSILTFGEKVGDQTRQAPQTSSTSLSATQIIARLVGGGIVSQEEVTHLRGEFVRKFSDLEDLFRARASLKSYIRTARLNDGPLSKSSLRLEWGRRG